MSDAIFIPYLSRKRNTNVSVMVMRTPAQSGILEEKQRTIYIFANYINMHFVNM